MFRGRKAYLAEQSMTNQLNIRKLYGPLNMLGSLYRSINQSMVDAEKLLNLLNQPTEVNDKPGAPDLVVTDGIITFGS